VRPPRIKAGGYGVFGEIVADRQVIYVICSFVVADQ
jgi:hypothetical protein